jgi:hypothetical protein
MPPVRQKRPGDVRLHVDDVDVSRWALLGLAQAVRGPQQSNGAIGIGRGSAESLERHRDAAHVADILAESERFALILDRAQAVPKFPPYVRATVQRVDQPLLEANQSQS